MDTTPKPEPLLLAPRPPEDWECCGGECGYVCIHEMYLREKAEYERLVQALQDNTHHT